jgi:hypothetical protein
MQVGKFFVTATNVGIPRAFCHLAALLLALAMIRHLFVAHVRLRLTSGSIALGCQLAPCM